MMKVHQEHLAGTSTSQWRITAHTVVDPSTEPDWRDQLAARLGQRPRRIGPWAELALHGARRCLDEAGETTLPPSASLRVASLSSAGLATQACIAQCRTGLPMPFSFMQSQPSQMLAALSQHLAWQGDAGFVVSRDKAAVRRLAEREAGPAGVLLGWVEEGDAARCEWWRLVPA
jgi:hypothetical protein